MEAAEELAALQQQVAEAFGRCLLRMQRIELALKFLTGGAFLRVKDGQVHRPDVADKTLGQVVGQVMETVLRPMDGVEGAAEADAERGRGRAQMVGGFAIGLPEAELALVQKDFADLVTTRNRMVHHFLMDHDTSTAEGCKLALAAVEVQMGRAGVVWAKVRDWLEDQGRMQAMLGEFLSRPEVMEVIITPPAPEA